MSAGNQDDVLSLMGSDQDNYSDIEELFGEKPRTRSADETSKKTRGRRPRQALQVQMHRRHGCVNKEKRRKASPSLFRK